MDASNTHCLHSVEWCFFESGVARSANEGLISAGGGFSVWAMVPREQLWYGDLGAPPGGAHPTPFEEKQRSKGREEKRKGGREIWES